MKQSFIAQKKNWETRRGKSVSTRKNTSCWPRLKKSTPRLKSAKTWKRLWRHRAITAGLRLKQRSKLSCRESGKRKERLFFRNSNQKRARLFPALSRELRAEPFFLTSAKP